MIHELESCPSSCFETMGTTPVGKWARCPSCRKERSQKDHVFLDDLQALAVNLEPWRADRGIYTIFDGPNTIETNGEVMHLELSKLTETSPELKNIATYIVTNIVRAQIMNAPRAQKKLVLFEELGALLDIPGAKTFVRDFYERSRKYSCEVITVIQQVSLIPDDLAISILGNSRQAFIFKQKLDADIKMLQKHFNLPDSAVQNLKGFPEPSAEHGAPFLHWVAGEGQHNEIHTAFNVASPEMLYVSSNSGEHFDQREKDLAKYPSVLEAIKKESRKDTV